MIIKLDYIYVIVFFNVFFSPFSILTTLSSYFSSIVPLHIRFNELLTLQILNDLPYYTGCPAILCAILLDLTRLFYSLFVNFFSQFPIPLFKKRKLSGQFPLKVQRGLRYLMFCFGEAFRKTIHSRKQLI